MAVERAYWSVRKTVEHAVGTALFNLGNSIALSGHERMAWPFIKYGAAMHMDADIPHTSLRFNPAILNPDGSLNVAAFREELQRAGIQEGADDQAYYWTPGWQADEKQADKDIRDGRVHRFPSVEEAVNFLRNQFPKN